jgi:hypothetical protein
MSSLPLEKAFLPIKNPAPILNSFHKNSFQKTEKAATVTRMSKWEKILLDVLRGTADTNISFSVQYRLGDEIHG